MRAKKPRKKMTARQRKASRKVTNRKSYLSTRRGTFEKRVKCVLYERKKVAKQAGIVFEITVEHFANSPRQCPICSAAFQYDNPRGKTDTSPSVDRIVPGLGYTVNNSWIICTRCNRIKNDATVEELRTLAARVELEIVNRNLDGA